MKVISGKVIYILFKPLIGLVLSETPRARAVVIHNKKILLLKNWIGSQRWTLPGGGVKKGEFPKEAIKRELFEELNLVINPKDLKRILRTKQVEESDSYPVFVFQVLSVKHLEFTVKKPEIIEAKWFELAALPEDLHPIVKQSIKSLKI